MRGIEAPVVGFERCILTGKREYLLILYPTFPLLDRIHFTINSDFFPLYGFQGFEFTFLSAFQGRYLIPLKSPCPFLWVQFNQIITGIVIGISVGSQPIIGYNYGAGKTARAQKTYLLAIVCSTIVMGLGTLLLQLFPDSIISIFGSESDLYREFAVKSLKIFLPLILLNGFQLCTGTFFQAIGKPVQATLISLSRQVLFLLPALLILPNFLGVEGALWTGPVGDACAFVLALIFGLVEWRKTNRSTQAIT